MKKRLCLLERVVSEQDELPSSVELDRRRVKVTKLATGRLVNGSSCDGIDMVIKKLDLEPKVYATDIVAEFCGPSRWKELSKESGSVDLDPRTEVRGMSIRFAPTGWCRIEEVPRCSLGKLDGIPIAFRGLFGVVFTFLRCRIQVRGKLHNIRENFYLDHKLDDLRKFFDYQSCGSVSLILEYEYEGFLAKSVVYLKLTRQETLNEAFRYFTAVPISGCPYKAKMDSGDESLSIQLFFDIQYNSPLWLCGACFKTYTLRAKFRHGTDFVPPPDNGDGVVRFVLYDLTKPQVPFCYEHLDHVEGLLHDQHGGFTLSLLDSLCSKGLRMVKSTPPKCRLGFSWVLKGALDKVIFKPDDISCWLVRETLVESSPSMLDGDEVDLDLSERNLKQCKRKICDGHYIVAVRVLSSSGVAPYNDATLQELKAKHLIKSAPSFPDIPINHHHLIASQVMVLDRIKNYPRGTSYGRDGLLAQHLMDCLSGVVVAIFDELVSSITQVVNLFLDGKCPMMLGEYISSAPLIPLVKSGVLSVGVMGGGEAILHAVNRLIEDRGDDVGLSMLLNSVTLTQPDCTMGNTPYGHVKGCNRPKEDPRSRIVGVFLSNISRPSHGVKLLGGLVSVDFDFSSELVMKRVAKTIRLMDAVAKINDPQCELLLLRACTGISKLYFAMRTCPPCIFEPAQRSFDVALHFSLECIVTASGPGFGDCDVLNYAFLASRLQSAGLQTKLLQHACIVASGPTFDDALCVFNTSMETNLLSNPKSTFSLSPRQMALWKSQREVHTSDWLRAVPISGLGQSVNASYNVVRDTLVDICFRSGISAGKEVDIGLDGGCDKPLHFVSGRAVIDAAQRKRVKYMTKCAAIVYMLLPFSFSSLGKLEEDAVTLLKRIRLRFASAICLIEDPYCVLPRRDSVHFISWLRFVSRIGCVLSKGLHCDLLIAICLPLKTYIAFWWKETLAKFLLLCSIDQGPFELGTTRNTLGTTPEGGVLLRLERPHTYDDLSDNEKKRYDADVRATNIVLQGLPKDIYKLINHNIEAKAIWDNVKMLLAGSELTKEDRESQLYD
ncbi:hypothetical protein Tco_1083152 [Tanacetum coccineum]|uniref:Uncharacterized protein n=1 Tax=Tanacetum coccineum TaxID=301880 RepID=A0ABQ5I2F2_9ASTR